MERREVGEEFKIREGKKIITKTLADDIGFCHEYFASYNIPFMFTWNLMRCVRDNFKPDEVEIIKKQLLKDKGKCDYFDIQSDKNNFTGKLLDGKTIKNSNDDLTKRVTSLNTKLHYILSTYQILLFFLNRYSYPPSPLLDAK